MRVSSRCSPVPVPVLPSGWIYDCLQPVLQWSHQIRLRCRVPHADATWSPVRAHSALVLVYRQLVPDAEARRCFMRQPARGLFALHHAPPTVSSLFRSLLQPSPSVMCAARSAVHR